MPDFPRRPQTAPMALNPTDLFDIRSLLSEEERMIQDSVARFTDEKVLPIIGDCFDQGRFPKELVPEIAAMRPTSRQRMQRLADDLAADGIVEFIDNPRHRRSRLVRLTRRGETHYQELQARLLTIASTLGPSLDEADIRRAGAIVRKIGDDVKARSRGPMLED